MITRAEPQGYSGFAAYHITSLARHTIVVRRFTFLLSFALSSAFAQRPPVLLVDGYHLLCDNGNLTSAHDFGDLQTRLQAEGVRVAFLGTCAFSGKPSIEELGNALGVAIRNLNAPQVDLVSHSMGGLIVRSYLAGKQTVSGVFTPPADTHVRKWVSIATPNFGALVPPLIAAFLPDVQARELVPGSQFLFDLATWNQNHDDLRGVDAAGIIGNAGGVGPFEGASDGTVSVTSASLSFAGADERTRVLPYCHGAGDLTSILGLGCDAPPLAKIQGDNPLSWQIIDSFLAGTDLWRSIGHSPSQDRILSRYGGILKQSRTSTDSPTGSIQDQNFVTGPPVTGTYTVVIDKAGPRIALIAPSAARLASLSLAPRMLISIYGNNLTGSTASVNGQPLALNYTGDQQINALLPDNVSGRAKLTVSNALGKQTTNIYVEKAVPAVFTADGSGTGAAAAIRSGNFISVYLTGLGAGGSAPVVLLNGAPVPVTYAGPAPGFPGLDQVNVQLPAGTASGTLVVMVGDRISNTVTVPPPLV
jgi:uncharacterized protein (TIGR03437 family)